MHRDQPPPQAGLVLDAGTNGGNEGSPGRAPGAACGRAQLRPTTTYLVTCKERSGGPRRDDIPSYRCGQGRNRRSCRALAGLLQGSCSAVARSCGLRFPPYWCCRACPRDPFEQEGSILEPDSLVHQDLVQCKTHRESPSTACKWWHSRHIRSPSRWHHLNPVWLRAMSSWSHPWDQPSPLLGAVHTVRYLWLP